MAKKNNIPELPFDEGDNHPSGDDFHKAFGIPFGDTLDIDKWNIGQNLAELYPKIEEEWIRAKAGENKNHKAMRDEVFQRIKENASIPFAGLHGNLSDTKELIERVHKGFLFNGAVTACGGTISSYKSVPLSVSQIGVCLINYEKQNGTYSHTLFRQDLRYKSGDSIEQIKELYENRKARADGTNKGEISELAIRGIRTFMERTILLEKRNPKSTWIMGSGTPAPYEIMTNIWGSKKEFADRSVDLMKRMIDHERFVYVHNCNRSPDLWTLGNALLPFEFLVIESMEEKLSHMVETGGTRGKIKELYSHFAKETGSKIAKGIFRVSMQAEPQIFYGHVDHIRTAALVAMADSAFQLYQGRPMLLDLASTLCKMAFNQNDIVATTYEASVRADMKLRNPPPNSKK